MDGFILTSDHVIPSFQDTEGPRAKSWTSLLKEETPEVSEVLRGTIERRAQQRPISPWQIVSTQVSAFIIIIIIDML